jgi:hypothetical protein
MNTNERNDGDPRAFGLIDHDDLEPDADPEECSACGDTYNPHCSCPKEAS